VGVLGTKALKAHSRCLRKGVPVQKERPQQKKEFGGGENEGVSEPLLVRTEKREDVLEEGTGTGIERRMDFKRAKEKGLGGSRIAPSHGEPKRYFPRGNAATDRDQNSPLGRIGEDGVKTSPRPGEKTWVERD